MGNTPIHNRDVLAVVIGGGVIGALTARELSKYDCSIVLLEKRGDVSMGASKANSGIVHAGFDALSGSKKAKFNVLGNLKMEGLCAELGVRFKRKGSLVLSFNDEQNGILGELYEQGSRNGVGGLSIISGNEVRNLEPEVSADVKTALLADTGGIVCPYTLTINAAENAMANGVDVYRNCEALKIRKEGCFFVITTNLGDIKCKYIVNAAGVNADDISHMAGDDSFSIHPRRGEYMLFDRKMGGAVTRTIFQTPVKKRGKGVMVTPTVDGNLLVGPNALDLERDGKMSIETTAFGQAEIIRGAGKSIPMLNKKGVMSGLITSFSGLRAISDTDDFIIGESPVVENFIQAAGIQSPGLSASPAIAEYVAGLISEKEGGLKKKEGFIPVVEPVCNVLELSEADIAHLVEQNPQYANVICRCETVTEGCIVSSINSPLGALDIDGVKRRTRAGMGRCQGGFCMPRVLEILARETGVKYTEITKNGDSSFILTSKR